MNKRLYRYFILLVPIIFILSFYGSVHNNTNDIANKLIRFHVIANSDSSEDQALKLKVRDRVLNELDPQMKKYKSIKDSKEYLSSKLGYIKTIVEDEIRTSGKNYNVVVTLGRSWFPAKTYGSIALPPGEYDALKIVIGNGEGKNWWCVMFPPLCFIDITHGITDAETERELKTVLSEDEYNDLLIEAAKYKNNEAVKKPLESKEKEKSSNQIYTQNKIEVKFKSIEIVKSLWSGFEKILGIAK